MSFLQKLKSGLSGSASRIGGGITRIFTHRAPDVETLEALEEMLITADLGVHTAARLVEVLRREKFEKESGADPVKEVLLREMVAILAPVAKPIALKERPEVLLVVGVNGNGKTTTIGKLAQQFRQQGKTVMLAACDTFRAAAVEQLQQWAERTGVVCITGAPNADPASVAFKAREEAMAAGVDVLLMDTAGRLQNKKGLMEELVKISRVAKPTQTLMVLDATTGQNALSQVKTFQEMVQVSGLVVTKLDGSAKGGVLLALADQCSLPVHAIGVGEGVEDLQPFDPEAFARSLLEM